MLRLTFALLPALILAAGCSGSSRTDDAPAELTVTLREGDRTDIRPYNAALAFIHKTAESRCPVRAQCIVAGEASISVSFTPRRGKEAIFELVITPVGAPVDTLGYRFTLQTLTPYPTPEAPMPAGPALATVRIARTCL